jgi:hypothetical protein
VTNLVRELSVRGTLVQTKRVNDWQDTLRREAIRLYERYAVEVVERFRLCPWAERTRQQGRVHLHVLLQRSLDEHDACLRAIETLAQDETADVCLLIFPMIRADRLAFEHFVRELREQQRGPDGASTSPFAMAAFHPQADPNLKSALTLLPFIRRTPDPTIQLVRTALLEGVREGTPGGTEFLNLSSLSAGHSWGTPEKSLRDRIAEGNLATITKHGVDAVRELLDDIARDRRASYAQIEEHSSPDSRTGNLETPGE